MTEPAAPPPLRLEELGELGLRDGDSLTLRGTSEWTPEAETLLSEQLRAVFPDHWLEVSGLEVTIHIGKSPRAEEGPR